MDYLYLWDIEYRVLSEMQFKFLHVKFSFFFFFFLATLCGLWDLSPLTRDWIQATAVKVPSPNHWTAREFPVKLYFKKHFSYKSSEITKNSFVA